MLKRVFSYLFLILFALALVSVASRSFGQFPTAVMNVPAAAGGGSHIIAWSVEITQSQCGGSTSDTFTIPVYLKNDSLKHTSLGGYVADWEGDDIRFYLTDTTSLLHWYKVRYRPDSGIYEGWVKVYATNVNFKMCIGSTTVTTFQGGDTADVWKSTVLAAYPMNDTTGTDLTDISGHRHQATRTNTPVRVPGQIGYAISMTAASTQYYSTPLSELNGATKVTMSFFGQRASSSSTVEQGKRESGSGGIGITSYMYGDGFLYLQINGGYGSVSSTGTAWKHCVMVFDGGGATSADKCKIYLNGSNQILGFGGTLPSSVATVSSDFRIGRDGNFTDYQSGITDMLIIYKTNVSAAWATTLYNSQTNLPNLGNSGTPFLRFIRS
jgi:hypothetical protein